MTLVGNDASGRVALRAGFRREGILRRYLPFRDHTVDAVMYAMLRGQPYFRQGLSRTTDTMQLIGGYDNTGWHDGLLLNAGRLQV